MREVHPLLTQRRAGVLLHPTSLPGAGPIGRLGTAAEEWIDALAGAGFTVWQTLPLCPPDSLGSPYQSCSVFAGDERLVDPERLPGLNGTGVVDHGLTLAQWEAVHDALMADVDLRTRFDAFCAAEAYWLEDFALYQAIKEREAAPWHAWPEPLRDRDAVALEQACCELGDSMRRTRTAQFFFDLQWRALRQYAHDRGVLLFGDLPIFVAHDSADVWAHRDLFHLDETGQMTQVAGVPPDYFSADGQLWNMPHYRWDVLAQQGYGWWIDRFRRQREWFDLIRIDHFRGFESAWAVPAGAVNAVHGVWQSAAGVDLFAAVDAALGAQALVAEDLGLITAQVDELRLTLGMPGMRVLQFAFDSDAENPHLPHNYDPLTVVYPGTHDNPTLCGWWRSLPQERQSEIQAYLGVSSVQMPDAFIRLALASVARFAIVAFQDLLALGDEARMNTPGTTVGNWSWRMNAADLEGEWRTRWKGDLLRFGRCHNL
ncbi:MAG TPA: 4-alpha-glucanotransferase [Candidatus Acidoferrales bacterium]|nr:4-alpha-glucanotransferase [Candidatus Acidoferrales bacterium]